MKCVFDNCSKDSTVHKMCRYHYYRSDIYRNIDKKRYRNNLEHERERIRIKSQKNKAKRSKQGIEYRTKIAKVLEDIYNMPRTKKYTLKLTVQRNRLEYGKE